MADGKTERHWESTAALVLLVLGVGVFAFLGAGRVLPPEQTPVQSTPAVARSTTVEFDRFSALRERSPDGEQLRVSLRLRTNGESELACFVFVVARNDHATPKACAIWPPEAPGLAITSGGHFHGGDPKTGHAVTLTGSWQRVTATLPYQTSSKPYDTVLLYVVGADGKVFLARPFPA